MGASLMARPLKNLCYATKQGRLFHGKAEEVLTSRVADSFRGNVQLIFTSPPFPLNRKKRYGNLTGDQFVDWLAAFGSIFKDILAPNGSIVIEMGNSWVPNEPVMSTLALKSLLAFQERNQLHLCQEFICHNPARLPSPAQWVTIERIRLKDSHTKLWWMSPSTRPKANNRNVLAEYSPSMKKLLKTQHYNPGARPSEHVINETSFLTDNGGAIPPSVFSMANTMAGDPYQRFCKEQGLESHPARMPKALAEFFIRYLTDPGDLVLDPFGGSNTTGEAAENLGRRWLTVEANLEYIRGSVGRFPQARSYLKPVALKQDAT